MVKNIGDKIEPFGKSLEDELYELIREHIAKNPDKYNARDPGMPNYIAFQIKIEFEGNPASSGRSLINIRNISEAMKDDV